MNVIAPIFNNMAYVFKAQGKVPEARAFWEQSLVIRRHALGLR